MLPGGAQQQLEHPLLSGIATTGIRTKLAGGGV
jgi:hypothetical protein